jgi:hypothetical protein
VCVRARVSIPRFQNSARWPALSCLLPNESGRNDTSGADQPAPVLRPAEANHLDKPARTRGVHHPSAADVLADVSEPGDEEHVARLEP